MWEYARKIQLVDSILEKSELTEKDAAEIGKIIKKSIRERHDIEALALKTKVDGIWSEDKGFQQQNHVKIFTTKELYHHE